MVEITPDEVYILTGKELEKIKAHAHSLLHILPDNPHQALLVLTYMTELTQQTTGRRVAAVRIKE